MRRPTLLGLLLICPVALLGQTAAPVTKAAGTITGPDVARRIGIIADDSMMGRDTPSRGLDLTGDDVLRGPIAIKHPYLPDDIKVITYNIVSEDVTNRLHEAWKQYIGRMK